MRTVLGNIIENSLDIVRLDAVCITFLPPDQMEIGMFVISNWILELYPIVGKIAFYNHDMTHK